MKFLLDESAEVQISDFLEALGYDVKIVLRDYPIGIADDQVLRLAHSEQRIVITNDRDFGELVFKTAIPRNVRLAECPSFGKPVCLYDPNSSGAISYYAVAQEVLSKLFVPVTQPVERTG